MNGHDLPVGQQQARTRWGTQESGVAFDRKKTCYLTEQAQQFMAQQGLCVMCGLDVHNELAGLLALGMPGFVESVGPHQCLLQLDGYLTETRLVQRLYQAPAGSTHLGLFFICHTTRQRLCVQGSAELLARAPIDQPSRASLWKRLPRLIAGQKNGTLARFRQSLWVRVQVERAFFHCPKYIKTRIPGLTCAVGDSPAQKWESASLPISSQSFLSESVRAFLGKQVFCYLCTVDQKGQCAVNHRGGAPGFLVSLPPDTHSPGGIILLPDYAGNGAFEAIGNIFETGKAALLVPNYAAQVALFICGRAFVLEVADLAPEVAVGCPGAQRVVALAVQRVEVQRGDWSATLTYEQARAQASIQQSPPAIVCRL